MRAAALPLFALVVLAAAPGCRAEPAVTVSAAMSLADVMPRIDAAFTAGGGAKVDLNLAGSGTLVRQIAAGAPVDVLVSANEAQVDRIADRVALRRDLLSNHLVVVVPEGAAHPPRTPADLAGVRRLAIGAESVPAGTYARAFLEKAGLLKALKDRLVPGDHVRAVLAAVASGQVQAGIVYATDAKVEPRVEVAFRVPDALVPPVRYPAVVLKDAPHPAAARAFLDFLSTSPEARRAFEAAGFEVLR